MFDRTLPDHHAKFLAVLQWLTEYSGFSKVKESSWVRGEVPYV
jgi:hypothetical protein